MRSYSFVFSEGTPVRTYAIRRVDGVEFNWCDFGSPVTFQSYEYPTVPGFKAYAITERNDGTPASTQFDVSAYPGGMFDPTEIALGMFDDADFWIYIVNADGDPNNVNLVDDFEFRGKISLTTQTRYDLVTFEARAYDRWWNRQIVENYSLLCRHQFSNAFCGVTQVWDDFTVGAVVDIHNISFSSLSNGSAVDGYYNPGRIRFTSGRNKNRIFQVGFWVQGTLTATCFQPIGLCTQVGDTGQIRQDCNKTLTMCGSRFSNQQHHGGFPRYAGAKAAATSDF